MMLARSLGNLEHQDFGFEIQSRVLVSLNRPPATYTARKLAALYRDIEDAARIACRACEGTGLALYNPLTDNWGELVLVAGHPPPEARRAGRRVVGSGQRELPAEPRRDAGPRPSLQRRGQRDDANAVAVVNEAFVHRFFKSDEDPIDQHFGLDLPENVNTYRIVGIVRDAKFAGVRARSAGAADVLRAAGADGRLHQPADEAARVPVALRARAAAGHEHRRRARSSRRSSGRSPRSIRT